MMAAFSAVAAAPSAGMPAAAGSGHVADNFGTVSQNMLRFFSFNARTLFNKMDELHQLTVAHKPAFVCVQETWCLPEEPKSIYHIPGYILERKDRSDRPGGGVCVYVQSAAFNSYQRLHDLESADCEGIWLQLSPRHGQPFIVCSLYRPPGHLSQHFALTLERSLAKAKKTGHPVLMAGDLNARSSDWFDGDMSDDAGEQLQQLFRTYDLTQIVSFPTNIYGGRLKSCIDVVATDLVNTQVSSLPPVGASDHVLITGTLPLNTCPPAHQTCRLVWCWTKADLIKLRAAVENADWPEFSAADVDNIDMDCAWREWKTTLLSLAKEHIPRKRSSRFEPRPWVNGEFITNVRRKHQLFRRFQRSRQPVHWQEYCRQRNYVRLLGRKAKSRFVLELDDAAEDGRTTHANLPRLYQLLRCLLKVKTGFIPDLLSPTGTTVSSDAGKADVLNQFFIATARESAGGGRLPPIALPPPEDPGDILREFTIPADFVRKALGNLNVRKAAGGDGIPSRLLRLLAPELSMSVHNLFTASVRSGRLPSEWKEATVTPLYKERGSRQDPSNYRPISLLSTLSKVLESCVATQLALHVDKYLPATQSGFRKKDGTEYQLARIVHRLCKGIDDGHVPLTCYFDMSKAFDRVWHYGLLRKLHHIGVRDKALSWLEHYLSDRQQQVRVNTSTSPWATVPAGVPQGSVLGPLLFLIYTCDLPLVITDASTNCDQFADDTALATVCPSCTDAEEGLQESVTNATRWLQTWKLAVNRRKTVVMASSRRPLPLAFNITFVDGVPLSRVDSHKHLGIYISSDLRWEQQVTYVLSRAARQLAVLKRLRSSLSQAALSKFYTMYIRPSLEYASTVWGSLPLRLTERLERFQRRAAKIILRRSLFAPSDHDELLLTLQWPTLYSRRQYRSAILGYRIAKKLVPSHLLESAATFPTREVPYGLRRPGHFATPIPNTLLYMDSPLFHAVTTFNQLSSDTRSKETLALFKESARGELLSHKCPCTGHIRL